MAGHPAVEALPAYPLAELMETTNGTVAATTADGQPTWRWQPNPGQTALLSLRPTHPLFGRLRYYDRFDFEFRVAAGEVSELEFYAVGHVSGARQYKVHQWEVAVRTTPTGVWLRRQLDLARPNWLPWDNPDGEGPDGYFQFRVLALTPGTTIEFRQLQLARAILLLKPDYELPITWPVGQPAADGGMAYTFGLEVLNASGRPTAVAAAVRSRHQHFAVTVEPAQTTLKAAAVTRFTVTAKPSAAALAAAPELAAEPVQVTLVPAVQPEAVCLWQGTLVRPLSPTVRRQVVIPEAALAQIRAELAKGNAPLRQALGVDRAVAVADAFLEKRLDHLPEGHAHVGNNWPGVPGANPPRSLRPGTFMPEARDEQGDFREVGTALAGQVWKEYLGMTGGALANLGLAYAYTGDEKYARKAIELLLLFARQYTELSWYSLFDPPWNQGPNMLCSSRLASNSTYGSNWYLKGLCRLSSLVADSPSWTDDARQRVYLGFVLPYVTELTKFPGGISNMTDITNHNVLLLGLAFRDATMVHWSTHSDPGLLSRLRDLDSDGFSSEGRPLNYHFAAMQEYLPATSFLDNAGLAVAYPKARLPAALRMPYRRAALTGRVPNTGDCGRYQGVGRNALADYLVPSFPDQPWLAEIADPVTPAGILRHVLSGKTAAPDSWRQLLETGPSRFAEAGLAILRSGTTPETQVMVTLDYGRNVFHASLDRNQLTLLAGGQTFSHGPGTLYNAGSGGMTRRSEPRLESFCSHGSLSNNVVMVDLADQLPAVGTLLAWNPDPALQVAVSSVAGACPGVQHVRGVVLADGVVVVLDQLTAEAEHTYDFVYHNLGTIHCGPGWTAAPRAEPLGHTANYENLGNLQQLAGTGPLRLEWELAPPPGPPPATPVPPLRLRLWQLPVPGASSYLAETGMNNPDAQIVPDAAPTVLTRTKGRTVQFFTVLEPGRDAPKVAAVGPAGPDGILVTFASGRRLALTLNALLHDYGLKP